MGLSASVGPDVLRREFREFVESGEGKGMKLLGTRRGGRGTEQSAPRSKLGGANRAAQRQEEGKEVPRLL